MTLEALRTLDAVQTLAFAAVVLFVGHQVRRAVPPLARYNIPTPVIGGLLFAVLVLIAKSNGVTLLRFDDSLKTPLMIAFFTTIGFGASLGLLKKGGPQVLVFFGICFVAAGLQNIVGAAVAVTAGQSALFGVLCGSVTLTGGPATGLAFAPQFEKAGVAGAEVIAVAAATAGIVAGGLLGGPVGTFLIERLRRGSRRPPAKASVGPDPHTAAEVVEARLPEPVETTPVGEDVGAFVLLKNLGVLLVAMWAGHWVGVAASGLTFELPEFLGAKEIPLTLPAYIGAMLVAAVIRNVDDVTGVFRLSQRTLDDVGEVSLAFFLAVTLMTLDLSLLAAVAGPLLAVLAFQVLLVAGFCFWPIFPWMGRDHDAAVIGGGFCGFMMGTTANAMANMDALARRYGPAPRAFLVVPMVGAFFIDLANTLLIQVSLWLAA